jgi:hypothetical protein
MSNETTDPLIGHRIIMIRPMVESEKKLVGFAEDRERCADGVTVLVLSNGATVFATSDPELNNGGHLVTACKGNLYDIYAYPHLRDSGKEVTA